MLRRLRLVSSEPVTSSGVSGSAFAACTPERRSSERSAGTAATAARAAGISAAFRPPVAGARPTLLQICTAARRPRTKRPAISSARPPP